MSLVGEMVLGVFSILIIVLSADKIVEKMEAVAKSFGVSEVVIAMTVISIGTSLPEISVHIVGSFNILSDPAAMQQVSATVLGMNIGSDVVQQTLIMGSVVFLASFMAGKDRMIFTHKFLKRDYIPMIGAHVMVLVLGLSGNLSRVDGILLVTLFLLYMLYLYTKRDEKLLRQGDAEPSSRPLIDMSFGLVGMGVLIYFSDIFLSVVETLIAETGLSGSMIGVATIGFVSAMPELTTALSALREGAEGLSLGTLIGSNITNPLMGIGIGAAISSYSVPNPLIYWDLPVQIATATVLVGYLWNKDKFRIFSPFFRKCGMEKTAERFSRMEKGVLTFVGGAALILLYIAYLYGRLRFFPADY